uniref:Uncharacterized protein n=1 Tax=Anguilla anguilla TaxID=7936 RepID=A0A0E9XFB2_ANGAN
MRMAALYTNLFTPKGRWIYVTYIQIRGLLACPCRQDTDGRAGLRDTPLTGLFACLSSLGRLLVSSDCLVFRLHVWV